MAVKQLLRSRALRGMAAVALLAALAALALLARPGTLPTMLTLTGERLTFSPDDRILILAPHPDDESLGTGGVIQQAVSLGLPVRVVFLTNGDANQWSFVLYRKQPEFLPGQAQAMGQVRHDEAIAAAHVLGLQPEQLTFLGYPDFGTQRIFTSHWHDAAPLRSLLTRVTQVPYADAYRPGAAYKGEEVLADLESIIKDFRPTKVFVSHPADRNPDHAALYTFTRVALWDLGLTPELYSYLVHFPRWPEPRRSAPALPLIPPASLASAEKWWALPLSIAEIDTKLAALKAHRSQFEDSPHYLSSFIRANELFGRYPEVDLAAEGSEMKLGAQAGEQDNLAGEGLTDEERAAFIGVEWRNVRREGSDLVVSLTLSRPLAKGVALSADLFGYRPDRAFADMPKILVRVTEFGATVYDQSRKLSDTGMTVSRDAHDIVVRVPLSLLGDPDRILVSGRTYLGDVPLDAAPWQVLHLRPQ
jgi:LmbE family N-acetylglucosaminyl deacetylase